MTKALRWGFSALLTVSCVGLGSVVGCSGDDDGPGVTDPDTGTTDTGTAPDTFTDPDTGMMGETSTDTGGGGDADAMVFKADRAVTILFAAPDMPARHLCLAAFAPMADVATVDKPVSAQPKAGAYGVPDPTAPGDYTKTLSGFPYGTVAPVPIDESALVALKTLKAVIYLLDENPAKTGKTCADMWTTVKGDPKRWQAFTPDTVKAGEHAILELRGCVAAPADTTGSCGTAGNNFEFAVEKVSMAKPATGDLGVQFLHLSQFPGNPAAVPPVPGWQSVDVYLAIGSSGSGGDAGVDAASDSAGDGAPDGTTDGGTTAPTLIKIAENVKYKDAPTALQGLTLPAGADVKLSYLVIGTRVGGAASLACLSAGPPSATCPNWTLPLAAFFSPTKGYQLVGGGLVAKTNQVIALIGSPVPKTAGDPTTAPLRIAFARAATWP